MLISLKDDELQKKKRFDIYGMNAWITLKTCKESATSNSYVNGIYRYKQGRVTNNSFQLKFDSSCHYITV